MPRMSQCKGVCVCICLLHASCIYLLQLYGASSLLSESTGLRGPETRELSCAPSSTDNSRFTDRQLTESSAPPRTNLIRFLGNIKNQGGRSWGADSSYRIFPYFIIS